MAVLQITNTLSWYDERFRMDALMKTNGRHTAVDAPSEPPSLPGDLMSELLLGMRLHGIQYHRVKMTPPFGIGFHSVDDHANFHFVAQGPVHLRTADGTPHRSEEH